MRSFVRVVLVAGLLLTSGCFEKANAPFEADPMVITVDERRGFNQDVIPHFKGEVTLTAGMNGLFIRAICVDSPSLEVTGPQGERLPSSVQSGAVVVRIFDAKPGRYDIKLENSEPCKFSVYAGKTPAGFLKRLREASPTPSPSP